MQKVYAWMITMLILLTLHRSLLLLNKDGNSEEERIDLKPMDVESIFYLSNLAFKL